MLEKTSIDGVLLGLVVLSVIGVLAPLFLYPMPTYIHNGDLALHYKLTSLISQDLSNIAYENYPKGFHLMSSAVHATGLSVGDSMAFVTLISTLIFPFAVYGLITKLFGDKRPALLTTLFALLTVPHNSALTGLTVPAPQTLALTLFPLTLYLFISEKHIPAGLVLGLHIITHGSWPLTILAVLVYTGFEYTQHRRKQILRSAAKTLLLGAAVALPFLAYIRANLFHDTIISGVASYQVYLTPMLPFVSFPFIFVPMFVLALGLYGIWRAYKDGAMRTHGHRFIASLLALTFLMTQAYFFTASGLAGGVTFIPSRIIPFLVLPLSVFAAFAVLELPKGTGYEKKFVLFVAALLIVTSLPDYTDWYGSRGQRISEEDFAVVSALQDAEGSVMYNPISYYALEGNIVDMGLKDRVGQKEAFLVLGGSRELAASFVLVKKGDALMEGFISGRGLERVVGTPKYDLYAAQPNVAEPPAGLDETLQAFSVFYNNHPNVKGVLREDLAVRVESTDTGETVCFALGETMRVEDCADDEVTLSATSDTLDELFSTYSITEFAYRLSWFYANDRLDVRADDDFRLEAVVPPIAPRAYDHELYLEDLDVSVRTSEENGKLLVVADKTKTGRKTSLKFLTRTAQWVLPNSPLTYPNALPGAVYAIFTVPSYRDGT